ncbi:MAG: protein kinase [Mycobacterium sp.]|uniref:serine/threonine protein kinase n=1 Tax=Mycobacterium sp. TaxID=1785 RepID=UPI003CC6B4F0
MRHPPPWSERWVPERTGGDAQHFRGGQGVSFTARARDGSGPRVLIKTLRPDRVRNLQARRRFKREVSAYETLAGLGPPRILDHNASTWEDRRTPMYMATEFVAGIVLQGYVEAGNAVDFETGLACVRELAAVLNRCHANDVTHRDLKPSNVVLRDSDITRPVLVDFGLSFNNADEDDPLTRLNEEVGNRFLRLPEHRSGGRAPASDVTQLAGIFFYVVTGREPLVLRDEYDLMPHRRPEARGVFEVLIDSRRRLRLLTVLDTAFATDLSRRYATAPDLISALENAMLSDQQGPGDLDDLLAQVDDVLINQGVSASSERRESLTAFLNSISRIATDFAQARKLHMSTASSTPGATSGEEWQERRAAVIAPGSRATTFPVYRIERRGPDDYVLLLDGNEVWRGESATDAPFTSAVQTALARQFLADHASPPATET